MTRQGSSQGVGAQDSSRGQQSVLQQSIEYVGTLSCWQQINRIEPLDGGITNINLKVDDNGRQYVVRLGEDIPEHGVMRFNELTISHAAELAGLSPAIHHAEAGVLVLDYLDAKALGDKDLHDIDVLTAVTALVRRVHTEVTLQLRGPVLSFWVFHVLRNYVALLRERESSHWPLLTGLASEAEKLEAAVGRIDLVLGHNDLLPANILRGEDRYWLIDWEYGGFNSPLFDLGGLATNAGLTHELEQHMLFTYLGHAPDNDFMQRYGAMKCASLMRETLWSMVSEIASDIEFDYASYTAENLDRYRQAFADYSSSRGFT